MIFLLHELILFFSRSLNLEITVLLLQEEGDFLYGAHALDIMQSVSQTWRLDFWVIPSEVSSQPHTDSHGESDLEVTQSSCKAALHEHFC